MTDYVIIAQHPERIRKADGVDKKDGLVLKNPDFYILD